MNVYGERMKEALERVRPQELAEMLDPEEFFTVLGEEIEDLIMIRSDQIADRQPSEGDYLAEVRRLNTARIEAESQVMREKLEELLPEKTEPGMGQ